MGSRLLFLWKLDSPCWAQVFFTLSSNDGLLEKSLDLVEECIENAMVQLAYYQHKFEQRYDANVKLKPLTIGEN